jgi:hypothetical protein
MREEDITFVVKFKLQKTRQHFCCLLIINCIFRLYISTVCLSLLPRPAALFFATHISTIQNDELLIIKLSWPLFFCVCVCVCLVYTQCSFKTYLLLFLSLLFRFLQTLTLSNRPFQNQDHEHNHDHEPFGNQHATYTTTTRNPAPRTNKKRRTYNSN